MDSPIGDLYILEENGYIIQISSSYTPSSEYKNEMSELLFMAVAQLKEYFIGVRKEFTIPIKLTGTEFQKKVWRKLLDLPYGKLCSYKDIAESIGNPKAVRAVGGANNKNPIMIIVPCHRVVGSNGSLIGYAAGLDKKEYLINLERGVISNKYKSINYE